MTSPSKSPQAEVHNGNRFSSLSMSIDTLRERIYRMPFHPVTSFLPSGKAVTVGNSELAMFSEAGRTLIVAQGERFLFVDAATVEAVETAAD